MLACFVVDDHGIAPRKWTSRPINSQQYPCGDISEASMSFLGANLYQGGIERSRMVTTPDEGFEYSCCLLGGIQEVIQGSVVFHARNTRG